MTQFMFHGQITINLPPRNIYIIFVIFIMFYLSPCVLKNCSVELFQTPQMLRSQRTEDDELTLCFTSTIKYHIIITNLISFKGLLWNFIETLLPVFLDHSCPPSCQPLYPLLPVLVCQPSCQPSHISGNKTCFTNSYVGLCLHLGPPCYT